MLGFHIINDAHQSIQAAYNPATTGSIPASASVTQTVGTSAAVTQIVGKSAEQEHGDDQIAAAEIKQIAVTEMGAPYRLDENG